MSYEVRTNNYDFFEASSAFQKSIRRGDIDTAMYFAVELYNSGFGEYLFKRMRIISSEDIGLAEPNISSEIRALYDNYSQEAKAKSKHMPERLYLTHAVILLCKAKKSRFIDWTLNKYWRLEEGTREIPDYAFDMHTRKGKIKGRGIDFFAEVGCKLNNHAPVEGEEEVAQECVEMIRNKIKDTGFNKVVRGSSKTKKEGTIF